jgi:rhodanese-related sulfurtransferase
MVFQRLFNKPSIEEVSAEEAKAKQQAGAMVVDVREPYEWREGYIPGAKLIPLRSLASRVQELDPSNEVIAVCRSGNRSMAGGMISWLRQHFPVSYI